MAKPKTESTEIVETPKNTEVVVHTYDDEDQGAGYEHQTSDDYNVPRVKLLQAGSPEVVSNQEGCQAGAWYNTVTQQVWKNPQGLIIVPATTRHAFAEFKPLDQGGGYRGQHEIDSPIVMQAKKESTEFGVYKTPEGNDLVENYYVYCILCSEDNEALGMATIGFKSTMIKVYKNYMSLIRSYQTADKQIPPLYDHRGRLTSFLKDFPGNTKAWVPIFTPAVQGSVAKSLIQNKTDDRFLMAKALRHLVDSGAAKTNFESETAGEGGGQPKGADGKPLF